MENEIINDNKQIVESSTDGKQRNVNNTKRLNYLDWDEYFMAVVFLSAQRSKDPCTQVGACIVDQQKRIIAVGYNGMPRGCDDDKFSWGKEVETLNNKHLYVVHAERNAILNKNSLNVENCTMYVGLFPCNECAKTIIQSGIKTVIYMSDKNEHKLETKASKIMFKAASVEYRQYVPKNSQIIINFNDISWNNQSQMPSTPAYYGS